MVSYLAITIGARKEDVSFQWGWLTNVLACTPDKHVQGWSSTQFQVWGGGATLPERGVREARVILEVGGSDFNETSPGWLVHEFSASRFSLWERRPYEALPLI